MEKDTLLDYDEAWDYYSDEEQEAYDNGFRDGELKGQRFSLYVLVTLVILSELLSKIEIYL